MPAPLHKGTAQANKSAAIWQPRTSWRGRPPNFSASLPGALLAGEQATSRRTASAAGAKCRTTLDCPFVVVAIFAGLLSLPPPPPSQFSWLTIAPGWRRVRQQVRAGCGHWPVRARVLARARPSLFLRPFQFSQFRHCNIAPPSAPLLWRQFVGRKIDFADCRPLFLIAPLPQPPRPCGRLARWAAAVASDLLFRELDGENRAEKLICRPGRELQFQLQLPPDEYRARSNRLNGR